MKKSLLVFGLLVSTACSTQPSRPTAPSAEAERNPSGSWNSGTDYGSDISGYYFGRINWVGSDLGLECGDLANPEEHKFRTRPMNPARFDTALFRTSAYNTRFPEIYRCKQDKEKLQRLMDEKAPGVLSRPKEQETWGQAWAVEYILEARPNKTMDQIRLRMQLAETTGVLVYKVDASRQDMADLEARGMKPFVSFGSYAGKVYGRTLWEETVTVPCTQIVPEWYKKLSKNKKLYCEGQDSKGNKISVLLEHQVGKYLGDAGDFTDLQLYSSIR